MKEDKDPYEKCWKKVWGEERWYEERWQVELRMQESATVKTQKKKPHKNH